MSLSCFSRGLDELGHGAQQRGGGLWVNGLSPPAELGLFKGDDDRADTEQIVHLHQLLAGEPETGKVGTDVVAEQDGVDASGGW